MTNRPFQTITETRTSRSFSRECLADDVHVEFSAGQHQRLIRGPNRRHTLLVRQKDGTIQWLLILTFESGVLVC